MRFNEFELKKILKKASKNNFDNLSTEEEISINIFNFIRTIYLNKQDFYSSKLDSKFLGDLEMSFKKRADCLIGHCRVEVKNENRIIDYLFTENGYELMNDIIEGDAKPSSEMPVSTNKNKQKKNQEAPENIFQLKITLKGTKPPIWRKVLVPNGITFYKLHKIIQIVFGWLDEHLFEFKFNDKTIGLPDPEAAAMEMIFTRRKKTLTLNAKKTKIDNILLKGSKFKYIYDFGDNWEHTVIVEKILEPDNEMHYPCCIDGSRRRPPEDIGGISGYEEFVEIVNDPEHPEYDDMLLWAEEDSGDGRYDPEDFNLTEINKALARIK